MWCTGHFMIKMGANFPRLRYEVAYWGPLLRDEYRNKSSLQSGPFPHDVKYHWNSFTKKSWLRCAQGYSGETRGKEAIGETQT